MPPTPVPLHPLLADAKDTWKTTETLMSWFSKLVTTMYGWSDGLIKLRQKRVDNEYRIRKAEEEAYRIMKEQEKRRQQPLNQTLNKRGFPDSGDEEDLDWSILMELLNEFD